MKKQVVFKIHFRWFKAFLDHTFFPLRVLAGWENLINFFLFFLKPSLRVLHIGVLGVSMTFMIIFLSSFRCYMAFLENLSVFWDIFFRIQDEFRPGVPIVDWCRCFKWCFGPFHGKFFAVFWLLFFIFFALLWDAIGNCCLFLSNILLNFIELTIIYPTVIFLQSINIAD